MKSADPRGKPRSIRFTAREDAALARAAKRSRLTIAAYIRFAVAKAVGSHD